MTTISSCISYSEAFPEYTNINQLGFLTPVQVATAYNMPASTGANVKVGIVSLAGSWWPGDFNNSMAQMGLTITSANITTVLIDGVAGTFSGTGYDQEATLDLYCVAGIVPQANIVVYIGQNSPIGFANIINRAVNENCDVISISWANRESVGYSVYIESALANAAAKGITVCVAAGDYGSEAYANASVLSVNYPATSPNVVAVGGTNLTLTSGNLRLSETVEYDDPNFSSAWGSGGGVSSIFPVPSWQTGLTANLYFSANGYSQVSTLTGRGIPDLSGPMNGYGLWFANTVTGIGGTSAATPIVAGMFARFISLNGGRRPIVGNSTVSAIHSLLYSNSSGYYDITTGNNDTALTEGYAATSGWDAVTGLGAPWGNVLYPIITSGGTKIKSNDGNWHYLDNVKVKTAANTWSNVRSIYTKTINGWQQTF
jgi:kumamolisin